MGNTCWVHRKKLSKMMLPISHHNGYESALSKMPRNSVKGGYQTRDINKQIWEIVSRIRLEKIKIDVYASVRKKSDTEIHNFDKTRKILTKLLDGFAKMYSVNNFHQAKMCIQVTEEILAKSILQGMGKHEIEDFLRPKVENQIHSIVRYNNHHFQLLKYGIKSKWIWVVWL